jgi:hypothetical protein
VVTEEAVEIAEVATETDNRTNKQMCQCENMQMPRRGIAKQSKSHFHIF